MTMYGLIWKWTQVYKIVGKFRELWWNVWKRTITYEPVLNWMAMWAIYENVKKCIIFPVKIYVLKDQFLTTRKIPHTQIYVMIPLLSTMKNLLMDQILNKHREMHRLQEENKNIHRNVWKCMKMYENVWKCKKMYENACKYRKM